MKNLGETIKSILVKKKITQLDVANRLGINPSYFSQLLKKDNCDAQFLEKICLLLQVSPLEFFDYESEDRADHIHDIHNHSQGGDAVLQIGKDENRIDASKLNERLLIEKDRLLKEKDERIKELKETIEDLRGIVKDLRQSR